VDPSTFLLISLAACTIWYGAYLSQGFFISLKDTVELENSTVKLGTAILMPIVGSVFLVLLFLFALDLLSSFGGYGICFFIRIFLLYLSLY
jgi:membrane protein DedA with SNARE-associated domain